MSQATSNKISVLTVRVCLLFSTCLGRAYCASCYTLEVHLTLTVLQLNMQDQHPNVIL